MARKQFIPAGLEYATFLADSIAGFKASRVPATAQTDLLKKVGALTDSAYKNLSKLEAAVAKAQAVEDTVKKAEFYRDKVFTVMQALRADVDSLEMIVSRDFWPVPTYVDLLFRL